MQPPAILPSLTTRSSWTEVALASPNLCNLQELTDFELA